MKQGRAVGAHRTPHPSAPGGHCQPAAPESPGCGVALRGESHPSWWVGTAELLEVLPEGLHSSFPGSGQNLDLLGARAGSLPRVVTAEPSNRQREAHQWPPASPRACTQAPGQARLTAQESGHEVR